MNDTIEVLHLEDSPLDAELILDKLTAEGVNCAVVRAQNRAGFEAALAGKAFDVILCDYNLPDYDGIAALKRAREVQPETPVILISGSIGEEEAVKSLHYGATDYLLKQHLERVAPAVRRALDEATMLRQRRRAEENLRESEMRFRQLAESIDDVFWMAAAETGSYLYLSPAYEKVWGRTCASLYASPQDWLESIHPGDRERVRRAVLARQVTGGFEEEYRIVRPDGTIRWVHDRAFPVHDSAGRVYRIAGVAKDITERKLAEEQLRRQAEVLESASDAIVISDPDARVIYWNRGAEHLFGWTKEEVVGKTVGEIMAPEAAGQIENLRRIADKAGEADGELRLHHKAGAALWARARTIFAGGGTGPGSTRISFYSDITEKRQMQEQLERAQRLEHLGMVAAGVAHDFNNILAPMVMAGPLLEAHVQAESGRRLLDIVEKSAARGAALVRQLLSFARGASGETQVLQLRHVLKDVAELAQATFPKSIRVEVHLSRDIWPVSANATKLHQVFLNLCVNARDAMPQGGVLKISAGNRALDAAAASAIEGGRSGDFVVVEVRDTGSGISPEVLQRIWEPFFTTKGPEKGTGLGLSTVRGILQSHNGFITLQTRLGQGTAFTVFLPAVESTVNGAEGSGTDMARYRGQGEVVLVVDDEESVRELAARILTEYGYRVVVARDGAEAISVFATQAEAVKLLLTDLQMPLLDGSTLVAALLRHHPGLRVIAMSGAHSCPPGLLEQLAHPLIRKPFSVETLLSAARAALHDEARSLPADGADPKK